MVERPNFFFNSDNLTGIEELDVAQWAAMVHGALTGPVKTMMAKNSPPSREDLERLGWVRDKKSWGVYGCVVWREYGVEGELRGGDEENTFLYIGSGCSYRGGLHGRRLDRECENPKHE